MGPKLRDTASLSFPGSYNFCELSPCSNCFPHIPRFALPGKCSLFSSEEQVIVTTQVPDDTSGDTRELTDPTQIIKDCEQKPRLGLDDRYRAPIYTFFYMNSLSAEAAKLNLILHKLAKCSEADNLLPIIRTWGIAWQEAVRQKWSPAASTYTPAFWDSRAGVNEWEEQLWWLNLECQCLLIRIQEAARVLSAAE